MGKYLRDITISTTRRFDPELKFNLETNFLEVLYYDYLPRVQTNGIGKVIVEAWKMSPHKKLEDMVDVLRLNKLLISNRTLERKRRHGRGLP